MQEHLSCPQDARDIGWIKEALQSAIEVEAATLPLYLAALFSLEIQNYPAYNLIRSIAMEEMVHMAIACNILCAVGGSPRLAGIDQQFPRRGLSGGAEPDLVIGLAKLSKAQLANFMRIETPRWLLPTQFAGEDYPTISRLYEAIRSAVTSNAEEIRRSAQSGNQVGDNIGFTTITRGDGGDLIEVIDAAIEEIVEQGEGSQNRALSAGRRFENEPSHYAKFAELYFGRTYREPLDQVVLSPETIEKYFEGERIPWPKTVNSLAVPGDGYAKIIEADPGGSIASVDLMAFDTAYTGILSDLESVWTADPAKSWPTLGRSVQSMVSLRVLSCFNIIRHQIPPAVVADLRHLYPEEFPRLAEYTDLDQPVFYGPRFGNLSSTKLITED